MKSDESSVHASDNVQFQKLLLEDEDILCKVDVDLIIDSDAYNKEMLRSEQEEMSRKLSNIAHAYMNSPSGHLSQIEINKAAATYVKLEEDSDESVIVISSSSENESEDNNEGMDIDEFLAMFKD